MLPAAATRFVGRASGGASTTSSGRSALLRASAAFAQDVVHVVCSNNNHNTNEDDGISAIIRRHYRTTAPPTMPRKSGASAFSRPRPPTRKARKRYHRRLRADHHERVGKHSPPGSRAAARRQFVDEQWDTLLDRAEGRLPTGTVEVLAALMEDEGGEDYDYGDAVLDDLMGNTAHLTSSPDPKPTYLGHRHDKFLNRIRAMMTGGSGGGSNSGGDGEDGCSCSTAATASTETTGPDQHRTTASRPITTYRSSSAPIEICTKNRPKPNRLVWRRRCSTCSTRPRSHRRRLVPIPTRRC